MLTRWIATPVSALALIVTAACGGGTAANNGAPDANKTVQINGAGATFPAPIYSKWFADYAKAHPDVAINYQPIGSGGGVRQLTAQTVFFGASDSPMTDEQLKAAPGPVLHVPMVLGADVPVYNLAGITDLKFTGPLLADIYLGKIKKWNDAAIATLNPGVKLPATDIAVAHRSDASGTTFIWVDFLSKVSPEWKMTVGASAAVNWPVGVGGKGNDGVAGIVSQTPGAIGYVELTYALQNDIAFGSVQNAAGEFVKASPDAVSKAAAGATIPDDFRVSITNAPGAGAYPISSFTWLLLYQQPSDTQRAKLMVDFARWALTEGQKYAAGLHYAPVPDSVVQRELTALATIKVS
ncbi:MAG TPA: phosphate ABC transporter substrate-binding protein PstS [Vicinamibacterales bacterium]|jgi:phosphate transport system substrate-binding protein|nr:phosphate ABC transporter substrate-binding protein PstS [Vicinamibacterales bacterium]